MGLLPLACWNPRREHEFSVLSGRGLCASDRSLTQRSPTECGVHECDREAMEKKVILHLKLGDDPFLSHPFRSLFINHPSNGRYKILPAVSVAKLWSK